MGKGGEEKRKRTNQIPGRPFSIMRAFILAYLGINSMWKSISEKRQCVCMCVCCVFFPFILDFNGRTSRGHTGRR